MATLRRAFQQFPRQWNPTQVPTFPVEIDGAHPLAQGLLWLFLPGVSNLDLSANAPAFNNASSASPPTIGGTSRGPAIYMPSGGQNITAPLNPTNAQQSLVVPPIYNISAGALAWGGVLTASSGSETILSGLQVNNNNSGSQYAIKLSGTTIYFTSNNNSLISLFISAAIGTLSTGIPLVVGLDWAVGGNATGYQNGALLSSQAATTSPPSWGANTQFFPIMSGTIPGFGGQAPHLYTNFLSGYAVPLGAAGQAWLAAEPFAMLRPVVRRTYVFVASGGGFSLTASQASWLWGANTANINQETALTATQQAWDWTGHAAGIDPQTGLTASQQSWKWTGNPAGTNYETGLTATQAAWQWIGNAAGFAQTNLFTAPQAAWQWTANAVNTNYETMLTAARAAWQWLGRTIPGFGPSGFGNVVRGVMRGVVKRVVRGSIRDDN